MGDTCLLHLRRTDRWEVLHAFPLGSSSAFGSTRPLIGSPTNRLDGLVFGRAEVVEGDVLVAATDAVAEWLLDNQSLHDLVATRSIAELQSMAAEERASRHRQ